MLAVPLGQLVLPAVQGTLLLPDVMGLKAWFEPVAARLYSMGLTLPKPFEDVASLTNARIPANVGAPAEVPPTAENAFATGVLFGSRKPFTQLPEEQIMYGS